VSESEQITATFGTQPEAVATKRLNPRPTAPRYEINSELTASADAPFANVPWPKLITVGIILSILVIGSLGVAWSLRSLSRATNALEINKSLIYPGSRTVVNVGDSGGAVLQLETSDPLEKVRAWYEVNLKPTKTLQVTPGSVILKNKDITATLVSEDKHTSIVIKQVR
jgi:hypothetical protein